MNKFNLEAAKQGAPIQTVDGRRLLFLHATESRVICKEPHEDGYSGWAIDGKWNPEHNPNGSCADIVMATDAYQQQLFD